MKEDRDKDNNSEDWRGKAVDLARDMGTFVARYVGGPIEQGFGIYEDKLKYMRLERQIRYMDRVNKILKERGLSQPTRPVPMKIAIPIFQAASLEDDDELQDRWATLLVNAADKDRSVDVRRTHISILENLGTLEVKILEKLYAPPRETPPKMFFTFDLPSEIHTQRSSSGTSFPSDEVHLALANLARFGCLESAMAWHGWNTRYIAVYQTELGAALHAACTSEPAK